LYNWLKEKLEISHGENNPLLSMEGLRGLAVSLVFFVHYSSLINPWISDYAIHVSHFIHSFGHLGVDLFFVLSGYLIYGSIVKKENFSVIKYSKRRIQRIYPTFLIVLAIYIVLSFVFPSESKLPPGVMEKLIYISQNLLLLPGIFDIAPIVTVAWSLSYEVFYYVLIPIVIFLLKLKSWKTENRIWLWGITSIICLIAYSFLGGPVRLIMFISGIILFELYSNNKFTLRKGGTRFLLLALTIFGYKSVYDFNNALSILLIFILFLLLCLCAFNNSSQAYKWLTYSPLRWLGNMSYSYYLIHGLTLKFCFLIFGIMMPADYISSSLYYWLWIPLFLFTLVVSFMLFLIVERPLSMQVDLDGKTSNKLIQRADKTAID
jgi:exopolysaccharide production protein ExoZ